MKATEIRYRSGNLHTVSFSDGKHVEAWIGIDGLTICPFQFAFSGRQLKPGTGRYTETMRAITERGFKAHSLDRFTVPAPDLAPIPLASIEVHSVARHNGRPDTGSAVFDDGMAITWYSTNGCHMELFNANDRRIGRQSRRATAILAWIDATTASEDCNAIIRAHRPKIVRFEICLLYTSPSPRDS